eukprot:2209972-Pyramimonas_sp.AAC.1
MNANTSPLRTVPSIPVELGCEAIEDELASDTATLDHIRMDPAVRPESVMGTPAYKTHPLVLEGIAAGRPLPIPVGVYLDG